MQNTVYISARPGGRGEALLRAILAQYRSTVCPTHEHNTWIVTVSGTTYAIRLLSPFGPPPEPGAFISGSPEESVSGTERLRNFLIPGSGEINEPRAMVRNVIGAAESMRYQVMPAGVEV